jgi:hypothetical protein
VLATKKKTPLVPPSRTPVLNRKNDNSVMPVSPVGGAFRFDGEADFWLAA